MSRISAIKRLDLGRLTVGGHEYPVHGFVVLHDELGAVLVDTGCGGPQTLIREHRVVNRVIADALAEHDLSPADIRIVVNSHLHFDHCGQNPVFEQARIIVQRAERDRVRRDDREVDEWLDTAGADFELVDGEVRLADDLRLVPTPGHTAGHQCVLAQTGDGLEVFVGDAAFTRPVWDRVIEPPPMQAADPERWLQSLETLRHMAPARIHFCHDQ